MRKKVVVGMSGGVDSSVAAYLLKQEGYEVIGVSMKLWCQEAEENLTLRAQGVAEQLGIRFETLDFQEEFRHKVMDYFAEEYLRGRTPNPCIVCNQHIKWEALLRCARELGAEALATGHYARVVALENGRYAIKRAKSVAKDQTYALYRLSQEALSHTLMPLGEYEKGAIRQIAEEIGLSVANQKDSQEICFIPDKDYAGFIRAEYAHVGDKSEPGSFVDVQGKVLGTHKGIIHYTIGQRKGLGAFGRPMFVKEIRPETGEVVLADGNEVFADTLLCDDLCYMAEGSFPDGERVEAKIRYSHRGAVGTLHPLGDRRLRVCFDEPQRAVTPGQAVVFYRDDCVLGGGTICS